MFVATTNFLSALILSRRICMLSAGLSCAIPGVAKASMIAMIAVLIVSLIKSLLIVSLLQASRFECQVSITILLKNLRSSFESLRTNGEPVEIMGDFSVHAERVEAFLGFSAESVTGSGKTSDSE